MRAYWGKVQERVNGGAVRLIVTEGTMAGGDMYLNYKSGSR